MERNEVSLQVGGLGLSRRRDVCSWEKEKEKKDEDNNYN